MRSVQHFIKHLERAAILMTEIRLWYTENAIESTSMYIKNSWVFKRCSNFNNLFKYQFIFIDNSDASSSWNIFSSGASPWYGNLLQWIWWIKIHYAAMVEKTLPSWLSTSLSVPVMYIQTADVLFKPEQTDTRIKCIFFFYDEIKHS